MKALVIVALAALTPSDGYSDQTLPFTCEQVRQFAAGRSRAELELLARLYRLTRTQRAQARACLTEKT